MTALDAHFDDLLEGDVRDTDKLYAMSWISFARLSDESRRCSTNIEALRIGLPRMVMFVILYRGRQSEIDQLNARLNSSQKGALLLRLTMVQVKVISTIFKEKGL